MARKNFKQQLRRVVRIQCLWRVKKARVVYRELKREARDVNNIKSLNKGLENKIMELKRKLDQKSEECKKAELKLEKAAESETTQEKLARETRNAALVVKTDAINSELRAKGPRLGNGAYYHEVDNSVKSRLYLSLGEEGRLRVNLKHQDLALENETTKSLVEKLNNLFKEEKNVTYERLK